MCRSNKNWNFVCKKSQTERTSKEDESAEFVMQMQLIRFEGTMTMCRGWRRSTFEFEQAELDPNFDWSTKNATDKLKSTNKIKLKKKKERVEIMLNLLF